MPVSNVGVLHHVIHSVYFMAGTQIQLPRFIHFNAPFPFGVSFYLTTFLGIAKQIASIDGIDRCNITGTSRLKTGNADQIIRITLVLLDTKYWLQKSGNLGLVLGASQLLVEVLARNFLW